MTEPGIIYFACPECKAQCRFSERQKAVQHSEPTCKTWGAHFPGNMQEFLRLALMAAQGNLILGTVGLLELKPDEAAPSAEQQAANAKAKDEILEQLYEGLKKL